MSEQNKRNIHYFESSSMHELFGSLQSWQNENNKRFLSISIEKDRGKFCCIALTNPTEVVITDKFGSSYAGVSFGALNITGDVSVV
jgi:hypothetical protein